MINFIRSLVRPSDEEICKQFLLYLMPEIEGVPNELHDFKKAKMIYDKHTKLIDSLLEMMKKVSDGSAFAEAEDGIQQVS